MKWLFNLVWFVWYGKNPWFGSVWFDKSPVRSTIALVLGWVTLAMTLGAVG
jgi:hypothetical protein